MPSPVTFETACTGTPTATDSTSATAAIDVVAEVGLRQHDNRVRAALPREHEVALEPAQVVVLRQRADEEDDVDVRGHHLLLADAVLVARRSCGRTPCAAAGRHGSSTCRPPAGRRATQSPTAGRSADSSASCSIRPGRPTRTSPWLGEDVVGAAMLHGDAAGDEPGGRVLVRIPVPVRAPSRAGKAPGPQRSRTTRDSFRSRDARRVARRNSERGVGRTRARMRRAQLS